MNTWAAVYDQIVVTIESMGGEPLIYRGQCNADWGLLPSLSRLKGRELPLIEDVTYFDFVTRAGDLLPANNTPWNTLFAMQHHGLPTRLLDWSETLGVALYFAMKGCMGDAAVWIVDPFELNSAAIGRDELLHPHDLRGDYHDYYITGRLPLEGKVVALSPLLHHRRVSNQRSAFTLHDDLETPLEQLYPDHVKKVVIPNSALSDAKAFLRLAGLSEFALFPDLDGLARDIRKSYHLDV